MEQPVNEVSWEGKKYPIAWKMRPDGGFWVSNWFSNMLPCAEPITWQDRSGLSVEHLYQSAKFQDPAKVREILQAKNPAQAKWKSKKWPIETPNWETRRLEVMWEICVQKWTLSAHRQEMLTRQTDLPLVEFVNWPDRVWGVIIDTQGNVYGGENYLGRILTEIREQLKLDPKRMPERPDWLKGTLQPELI